MSVVGRRGLQIDDPLAASRPVVASGPVQDGADRLRDIPLEQIRANPSQPRKRFDEEALVAPADSVRERGVLQPVIVGGI